MGSDRCRGLEEEVAGEYNTFRVYLFMLRVRKASARQVQKALLFSSPTLAAHHLEKLRSYNLAKKDSFGVYHVIPKSFGILKLFFISGRWIVPHTFFISVMFAIMTAGFLLNITQHEFFKVALTISVLGLIVSVYVTVQFYRTLPKNVMYYFLYDLYKRMINMAVDALQCRGQLVDLHIKET